ncbi:hypothetical protein TWF730_001811 [Orbilia blumenaviensis]|uniref:AAA+ ATPase domain-containing protein n=1 Tax=Orbilia blumenaviensis TaxID=1796055 RepID=A0AAV9UCI9_9PEZI
MAPRERRKGGKPRRNPGSNGSENGQQSSSAGSTTPRNPVAGSSQRRTPAPHSRLMPDLSTGIYNGGSIERSQAFISRFCSGELKLLDKDYAKNLLRAIIRQSEIRGGTEKCITLLGTSLHGLLTVVEALKYKENLEDISFLNDFVGQFFLFLTHLAGTGDSDSDVTSFDDHVRRIVGYILEENTDLFLHLMKATNSDQLNYDTLEGFARILTCYFEFSPKVPEHVQTIITNKKFIAQLIAAQDESVRSIGTTFKYWYECTLFPKSIGTRGKHSPGGRHDNDFQDYRKIRIIPTADELACMKIAYVPKTNMPFKCKGSPRVGAHLDTQFRLLREEMLNEVRADYYDCVPGKFNGPRPDNTSERPRQNFHHLQWDSWDFEADWKLRRWGIRLCVPEGFGKYLKFHGKSYEDLLRNSQNFPYKNNQLACLIIGGEVLGFGKLVRDLDGLTQEPPLIVLTLDDPDVIRHVVKKIQQVRKGGNQEESNITLVCVDSPLYAHEPILKRLQGMRAVPLAEELLHFEKGNQIAKTSFYPDGILDRIIPETPLRDLVKAGSVSTTMDRAQCDAIKRALQNKVSLIQGPPGTGKTMVGNVLAKLLYLYTKERILIITQQNHICDEFLENLLGMGVGQEHVIRLGSQYTNATRPVSVNELLGDSAPFKSVKLALDSIGSHVKGAWGMVNEAEAEVFNDKIDLNALRDIAIRYNEPNLTDPQDPYGYRSAFTVPEAWNKILMEADPQNEGLSDDAIFSMWATDQPCPPGMNDFMTPEAQELWRMPLDDRETLLGWFEEALVDDQIEALVHATTVFGRQVDEFNRWKDTRYRTLFKEKRIIAATTNGAAKYLSVIADVAPKILIIEEAAQILESHVLAALHDKVEQVIMIGDHKQLRPHCETRDFRSESEQGYDFDVSLFERLVKAGFPCDVLETQHRARPEIANIIRSLTYPDLKDHKSVNKLDRVRGLQRSVTWMAHQYGESSVDQAMQGQSKACKKSSKTNDFEADMVVAIVRYLGLQGYANDHIVVITPYLAQVGLITKKMRERGEWDVVLSQGDYHELVRAGLIEAKDLKGVNKYIGVSTIDQFQGSDRDIVIVSMVRCNPEQKASFIRAPERANVLLSRARKGLIILGDLYSVTDHGIPGANSIWRNVFQHFQENGHIFDGIPIVCENHPDQTQICRTPEELDFCAPEGRCRLPCGASLPCGKHHCPFFCHGGTDHTKMECKVVEKKKCLNGHEWEGFCWTKSPKSCEKCRKNEAHFKAMRDADDAKDAKEFEKKLADERRKLQQAEEANRRKLESERQKTLDSVRNQRLIAEGKVEPKPKRVPWVQPFGEEAERLIEKEQSERRARDIEELDRRIMEAAKADEAARVEEAKQGSPIKLGPRPLTVADLTERYSSKASSSDASEIGQQSKNGESSKVVPTQVQTPPSKTDAQSALQKKPQIPVRFRVPGVPPSEEPVTLFRRGIIDGGSGSELVFEVNIQAPTLRSSEKPTVQNNLGELQNNSSFQSHNQTSSISQTSSSIPETSSPIIANQGKPSSPSINTSQLHQDSSSEAIISSSLIPTVQQGLSDQVIPSPSPITITPLNQNSSSSRQSIPTMDNSNPILVEEVSDLEMGMENVSIDRSVLVEEPPTFIEDVSQVEDFTTIIVDHDASESNEFLETRPGANDVSEEILEAISDVDNNILEVINNGSNKILEAIDEGSNEILETVNDRSNEIMDAREADVAFNNDGNSLLEAPTLSSPSTLTDRVDSPKSTESPDFEAKVPESPKGEALESPKDPEPAETAQVSPKHKTNRLLGEDSRAETLPTVAQESPRTPATPLDGLFPSINRDEWQRHKEIAKDSNFALDKIMDMIGMEHVKEQVLAIKAKVDTVHRQGINLREERFHVALLGNPGTGKTTFARLYAEFLRSEGVIEGLSYIETTGARLAHDGISGLQAIFDQLLELKGGTLFIDEAYQLVTSGAFEGRQVLDFLLNEMENHLGKIVIIISGYNKEMEKFFEHNSGLNSRIPYRLQFEDFTNEELLYILQETIKNKFGRRMKIEDGYSGLYMRIVAKRLGRMRGMAGCGNARGVQNTVAKILERQAARVTKERKQGLDADDFLLTREDVIGPAPSKAAMESDSWKELHQLIGLNAVKESVQTLLKRMEKNYQRELAEERPIDISLNRVFLGSPGTGKTSVAKIYGKILCQLGLLSSGEVVTKTPSDLLGRALGESEANTKAILNASRGKVLIIDEAYSLNPKLNGSDDPYKSAVIDTIVSEVQNVPGDDQCVLLLGYKADLEKMFNAANPGLSRRFPLSDGFAFDDLTDVELGKIFDLKLRLAEIHVSPEAREVAIRKISQRRQKTNFGNAGEVENLLSVAKERMLKRQVEGGASAVELLVTDFDPDHDRGLSIDASLTDIFKDLIGLDHIIQRFEEYKATSLVMRARGIDPKDYIPSLFVFKGPPGTGKTTTARKMGQIFYDMGFLASNEVVECSVSELVAEYVGQTSNRTLNKIKQALGKVLFIDEAYRLQDNQYGLEASNELVDAVTKPQYMGKLVVILAGYDEGIDKLLAGNMGLASRFSEIMEFPDINCDIATEIVKNEVKKARVGIPSLEDSTDDKYAEIRGLIKNISETKNWGHARDAQNLARAMINKAYRSTKRIDDPVYVTHDTAVSVALNMWKERRGRYWKSAPRPAPTPTPSTPKARYAEPPQPSQAKVNGKPAEAAPKAEAVTKPAARAPVPPRVKPPPIVHVYEGPLEGGRERGATNANWAAVSQGTKSEEVRAEKLRQQQSELRQRLNEAKRAREDANAAHSGLILEHRGRNAPVFKKRIERAKVKAEEAERVATGLQQQLDDIIEQEKVREAREKVALTKLDRMGLCPKRYHWIKLGDGYRCAGGEHFVPNRDLDNYSLYVITIGWECGDELSTVEGRPITIAGVSFGS